MIDRALITDEELHAFIDGELDPLRASDIALLLEYRPDLQARVSGFRADKALLTEAYGAWVEQPVPAAWQAMIDRHRGGSPMPTSRRALFAIAASAAVAFAGWSTYTRLRPVPDDVIVAEALAARNDGLETVPVASDRRDAADRTVRTALDLRVKAPDMSKFGFELTAVRVYGGVPGGSAVKIDYRDAQQRLFTVYLRHTDGAERFDMLRRGPVRICVWQDEVLSAVMLAEVSAGEMLRLASLAYDGLNA